MGTLPSLTGSEAPNTQGTWGLGQEGWDGDSSLGVAEGESKRTEGTETCEQARLSMVVVESTELGVEQACTGGRGGGGGKGVGHTQCRKRVVAAMISNKQQIRAATGIPRGGHSTPRGSASRQRKLVRR
jgi:hypothetical protein